MSSFYCDKCGAIVSDTPGGYVTGCEHYPQESRARAEANYKAGLQRIQKRDRTAASQAGPTLPDLSNQRVESAPVPAAAPMQYSHEMAHLKIAALERELAAANARLWNYEHGTAGMCADAAIGAAKEWQKEVEALKVDAERYKDYANVLRLFIEGVEWDSELPLDVWAICQHWNNNAAIDAARGEK